MSADDPWLYVDVRSVAEFDRGHPAGSYNVPLLDLNPALGGMVPNPVFVPAMTAAFGKDGRLILGCQVGGRSLRAAQMLEQAGFTQVVEQRCGWDGAKDGMGRLTEPGWARVGLPAETMASAERTWAELRKRLQDGP
jgi:rhodanese-related sulfurtransferase